MNLKTNPCFLGLVFLYFFQKSLKKSKISHYGIDNQYHIMI